MQWRIYIVKFWTRAPRGSKFFQFHAVFGKIWQNRMLAPTPWGVGAPSSGKSWIRHCYVTQFRETLLFWFSAEILNYECKLPERLILLTGLESAHSLKYGPHEIWGNVLAVL